MHPDPKIYNVYLVQELLHFINNHPYISHYTSQVLYNFIHFYKI